MDPKIEYTTRLDKWREESARQERLFNRIASARLAIAGGAALLGWLAFLRGTLSGWWLLAPLAVFVVAVIIHDRVARRQEYARRASGFYQGGIARLEDRWAGAGDPGERFRDPAHVYSDDLDVFGRGSLFELLCTARTAAGEETLARWLTAPGNGAAEIRARQEAVAELRGCLDLREDLAMLGEDVRRGVHPELLTAWAAAPPMAFPRAGRPLAFALAGLAALSVVGWTAEWFGPSPLLAVALVELLVRYRLRQPVEQVVQAVDKPAHELDILSLVLERLERERFRSPRLAELLAALEASAEAKGRPASAVIRKLDKLVEQREWSENLMFRIPAFLLLWDEQFAMRIEQWRQAHGAEVGRWIAVVGEMEALSALAGYSYEHPADPFPELAEGWPCFQAKALRHPLMSARRCVPNDVRLGGDQALLIVSGSNMSGKSTLLRAVGLNTVLAWAGAPVSAAALQLSPLAAGASIRIVDSLQTGRSRFFAEITRLRQIVDLTGDRRPVLFVIDEMLHGTNSRDRRIGAEAVVRSLLERRAIGLITTHDLALADIAQALPAQAANVHFEDQIEDGQLRFDYRLRPGIVQRSNALELMRAVGLVV